MTAWPTRKIDTTHLDQDSDSPAHARAAIKAMADTLNAMMDAAGDPGGVATLDDGGEHPFRQMRGEVFTAAERTRLANLGASPDPPRPTPTPPRPTPTPPRPTPTPSGRKTFTTPGTFYFKVPSGVTRVRTQLQGGSGGDGSDYSRTVSGRGGSRTTTWRGGEGGDGGFIYFDIAVRADGTYPLIVGGNGADGARGRDGADGGDTTFLYGRASGGKGGKRAQNSRNGADGADGTSYAPFSPDVGSRSKQVQLVVPSPVSAGYVVVEWG